jgi:hypothetical protein
MELFAPRDAEHAGQGDRLRTRRGLAAFGTTLLLAGMLVVETTPLAGPVLWAFAAATAVAGVLAARAIDRGPALEPVPVRARRPGSAGVPRRW